MRLNSTRSPDIFWVDWWLMNHCSWRCTYCADIIRNGTIALPALKDCESFLNSAISHAHSQGRSLHINFTGGEITEWPQLIDFLSRCQSSKAYSSIRTNGHCDSTVWEKVTQSVNHVNLLFHPQHSSISKFLLAIETAVNVGCGLRVTLNMMPDRFQEMLDLEVKIQSRWPCVVIDKHMLFQDPVFNNKPENYTKQQQNHLQQQSGDILLEQDGQIVRTDFQTMVIQDKNRFQGAQCRAGLDQIIVDAWGKVFRSHCRQWGSIGHIGGDIRWPEDPMTCMKPNCANGFDILASKQLD